MEIKDGRRILFPLAYFPLPLNETQQPYSMIEKNMFALLNVLDHAQPMLLKQYKHTLINRVESVSVRPHELPISVSRNSRISSILTAWISNIYRASSMSCVEFLNTYALEGQPELTLQRWDRMNHMCNNGSLPEKHSYYFCKISRYLHNVALFTLPSNETILYVFGAVCSRMR